MVERNQVGMLDGHAMDVVQWNLTLGRTRRFTKMPTEPNFAPFRTLFLASFRELRLGEVRILGILESSCAAWRRAGGERVQPLVLSSVFSSAMAPPRLLIGGSGCVP